MPPLRRFLTPDWRWFVITIALLLFVVPPLRRVTEGALGAVSRPMLVFGQSISQRWLPGATVRQLIAERDVWRDQVAALTARLAEAQQQLKTGATVSELTEYIGTLKSPSIVAGVIAYGPDPGIESVVISRGRADGLEPGMAVVTSDGVMIGKVRTAAGRTATVLLLSDSHSQVAARIQNESRSPGIVGGERGLAMAMNFIPTNDEVKPGQTVVTSGTERLVPPDIVIGTIRSTSSQPGELFRRATLVLPVELNRVRVVAVILVRP